MSEQIEFLKLVVGRLESAGVPYMVTGSVASAFYARPRMTRDIDLVVECGPDDASTFVRLFERDCYVAAEAIDDAIRNRTPFSVIHNAWLVKADLIVRKVDAYRDIEFARRRRLDLEGTGVWVATPEDLVLSKLAWAKDSDSELQRADARALLESARNLDWAYMDKWAEYLEVGDLLHRTKGS